MKYLEIWLSLCACFLGPGHASPLSRRAGYAIKDRHPVPGGWAKVGRPSSDRRTQLRIGLKHNSFEALEERLLEISDPEHHHYGQWLSSDQIHEYSAPSPGSLESVQSWLKQHNIDSDRIRYTASKDWLTLDLSMSQVEHLLDTQYYIFENEGVQLVRTEEYSLPETIHDHIDVIHPTNHFGNQAQIVQSKTRSRSRSIPSEGSSLQDNLIERRGQKDEAVAKVCDPEAITSTCVRTMYGFDDYVPQVPDLNSVAITAFLNESANYSDFRIFMAEMRKDADPEYSFEYTTINNGIDYQLLETDFWGQRDNEANLDIQTLGGLVYPTPMRVYSTGGLAPFHPDIHLLEAGNEPYHEWVSHMLAAPTPPALIVSTSYADREQTVPRAYADRVCKEFAMLGARGVTLLFASGDKGVGRNGTCITNDGLSREEFLPYFPAGCPYVTTVGGTMGWQPEVVGYDEEREYVSGGGFSNYFARPKYQDSAVEGYLAKLGGKHEGRFDRWGRAYPDISAQSVGFVTVYGGEDGTLDGTSASTPLVAGLLANVNDALLAKGRPPLGFINPWLYRLGYPAFTDVTEGNIAGCDTDGFPATEGWDAASGFGTPDFKKILEQFMAGS